MGVLALIGVIYIIYRLISEACEPELPSSYHNNMKKEVEDANKVMLGEMSKREFNRNIRNGKYR